LKSAQKTVPRQVELQVLASAMDLTKNSSRASVIILLSLNLDLGTKYASSKQLSSIYHSYQEHLPGP
jgi:hypothetical protein